MSTGTLDTLDALDALRQAARRDLMVSGAGGDAGDLDLAVEICSITELYASSLVCLHGLKGDAPPITETPAGREAAGEEKETRS